MAKNRLGRGLSAILEDVEDAYKQDIEDDNTKVKEINISDIAPNPFQPRKHFDQNSIKELSESILKHGLIQPIVVVQKDDGYMLIAGERRLRASKLANLEKINAIIASYESENLRELALIENIQREDLNPIELAHSYKELIDEYSITQEELANIIHKSRTQITNTLRLLNLSDYTKNLLIEGKITQGHAKVLVGLDEAEEKKIVDTIVGQKLSTRESENLIKSIKQGKNRTDSSSKVLQNVKNLEEIVTNLKKLGFLAKQSKNSLVMKFRDEDEQKRFAFLLQSALR